MSEQWLNWPERGKKIDTQAQAEDRREQIKASVASLSSAIDTWMGLPDKNQARDKQKAILLLDSARKLLRVIEAELSRLSRERGEMETEIHEQHQDFCKALDGVMDERDAALKELSRLSRVEQALRELAVKWRDEAAPYLSGAGDEAEWAACRVHCADELYAALSASPEAQPEEE